MSARDASIDPTSAKSAVDLGRSLTLLRERAGLTQAQVAKKGHISATTVSEVEKGKRLPRAENLLRYLDACGVADETVLQLWLDARANIVTLGSDPVSDPSAPLDPVADEAADPSVGERVTPESPEPARPEPAPDRRRSRRWWVISSVAVAVALVGAAAWFLMRPEEPALWCVPENCTPPGPAVTLYGRLPQERPPGHEPYVLLRVDNENRWYVSTAIIADDSGRWSADVPIGAPKKQDKDRHLTACSAFLPSSALGPVIELQKSRGGAGLTPDELPAGYTELACVKAVRAAGTE